MKTLKKLLLSLIVLLFAIGAFYFFWLYPRYAVPILAYHDFGSGGGNLVVTPENFSRQMEYIKKKGYEVISLDELVEGIKNNRKFRHKTVVITADDGYKATYTYAYPILRKYGFTATIFLVANLMGNQEYYMDWNEVRAMLKGNISFGGHTKNHVYLPFINKKEELWDEIAGCKKLIEDKIDTPADYFCYPTGGFTEEIKEIVEKAGYKGACTSNRGFGDLNKDVYELKRIKVTNHDTHRPLSFWAKLSGYYNLFRRDKRGNGGD